VHYGPISYYRLGWAAPRLRLREIFPVPHRRRIVAIITPPAVLGPAKAIAGVSFVPRLVGRSLVGAIGR
jgi:hypothetical protein